MTTARTEPTEPTPTTGAAPSVIVFGVDDLGAAKTLYTAVLGVEPYADTPYYVGFHAGDVEIGLDPNAARQGTTAPIAYWTTDDVDARVQALVAAGATVQRPPSDVGGGQVVALLADAAGNPVGLRSA
jgi:predicted enzyme related to lactoylglutathione lyase